MATALLSSRTDALSFSAQFGTLSLLSVRSASPVLLTSTGPLGPSILRVHPCVAPVAASQCGRAAALPPALPLLYST